MVSIFNGAQGNPGGDESFAKGQYCIYTERSGSADMDLPEVLSPPFTTPKSSFRVRHQEKGAREVALVHGGQNPITPQSKTIFLPPARHPARSNIFLTEVTSM